MSRGVGGGASTEGSRDFIIERERERERESEMERPRRQVRRTKLFFISYLSILFIQNTFVFGIQ